MIWLLDGNVLTALTIDTHEHHRRVRKWFDGMGVPFATCAATEGTLLRLHLRLVGEGADSAWQVLQAIHEHPDHVFWDAGFSYRKVNCKGLLGSAQVTDAWLTELARQKGGRLATLDEGLARIAPKDAFLLPR